jgi:hypothetical protein
MYRIDGDDRLRLGYDAWKNTEGRDNDLGLCPEDGRKQEEYEQPYGVTTLHNR